MTTIIERFSQATIRLLQETEKLCRSKKRSVDSDSLIVALFELQTTAGQILEQSGAKKERILSDFDAAKYYQDQSSHQLSQPIKLNSLREIRQILQDAAKLAFQYGFWQIEPEHLLFAVIERPESAGSKLLLKSGVDLVRTKIFLSEWFSGMADIVRLTGEVDSDQTKSAEEFSEDNCPALSFFTTDLTALAEENRLEPVAGREKEIAFLCSILGRKIKNNPLIIGEPGVGKTALVEGLAQAIVSKNVPQRLINKKVLSLNLGKLIAGTTLRGQFEERMTEIIEEAREVGNVILFIDELHNIRGAGSGEGTLDVAQMLKPSLAGGEFSIIGATTFDEYRKYLEKDRALARRFTTLYLNPPSPAETLKILTKLKPGLEKHHRLRINKEVLETVVDLADQYIKDRFFPDKAIDLLDEVASSVQPVFQKNEESERLKEELKQVIKDKLQAVNSSAYDLARQLSQTEKKLAKKLETIEKASQKKTKKLTVTKKDIIRILSQKLNIPIQAKDSSDNQLTAPKIEKILRSHIIGQNTALRKISQSLAFINQQKNERGPKASFIFIGPSGVGKTETARVIAEKIIGLKDSLIRLDMSEFSERHSVSTLIGSPAGFVGYEEGGRLTNTVRKKPYSVVLFDEIEKAHPDIFNLLLQILEEGTLTDNFGRVVSFHNTVIVMTSNLGNDELDSQNPIGFQSKQISIKDQARQTDAFYRQQLTDFLSTELLGRITEVVVFQALSDAAVTRLFIRELAQVKKFFRQQNLELHLPNQKLVVDFLRKKYNLKEGARSVKKIIKSQIERTVIDSLAENPDSRRLLLTVKDGRLVSSNKAANQVIKR